MTDLAYDEHSPEHLPDAQRTVVAPAEPISNNAKPIPRVNIQAFCDDPATAERIQEASHDRRLAKAHVTVQLGGMAAALSFYANAPTPNLILVESQLRSDALLAQLEELAAVCDSGTKVVVVGHVNDVMLYRGLMQQGVSEYLVAPLSISQVMECLSNIYNDPESDPVGSVFAFVGAKGGCGSSTICHNVAWSISRGVQSDVVIADFDLPFGTAGLDFNQDPVQGLADALRSPERLDEVLLDRLLSRCSDHLSLFAAPSTLDRTYDVTTESCETVIEVIRKSVPYVAADIPHMWTAWSEQLIYEADQIVITAIPDLANLRNAKNLIEKLKAFRPNDKPPYLVLNQVGVPKRPEIAAKEFAQALESELHAVIEFDPQLFGTAANNGQMLEEVSDKSRAADQLRDLAFTLADRTEPKVESSSILGPILSRFGFGKSGG